MTNETIVFSCFLVAVLFMLVLDLGVFNKKSHAISMKEALIWASVWVSMSLAFFVFLRTNGNILHGITSPEMLNELAVKYDHPISLTGLNYDDAVSLYNENLSLEYITGYLIEYALSVDNIFIMIMIFIAFGVNQKYYHRILFWGILGAIVLRFTFIFLSSALIQNFGWILYVFGGVLIFTGIKLFVSRNQEEDVDIEKHIVVRVASKYLPISKHVSNSDFVVREKGRKLFSPLFLVLIVIEFTDVIFATDSIPAIFSVTKDPFIIFFSNVFAILGLRSLFFILVNIMNKFHYLKTGLSFLLTFIGLKLLFHHQLTHFGFKTIHSLFIVVFILGVSIAASLVFPKKTEIAK